jgi:hypothetical protein
VNHRLVYGTGNRDYTVARLARDHPELVEEVMTGSLSPNAAGIKAGFRKKVSPFESACRQIAKLTSEERHKLKELLS